MASKYEFGGMTFFVSRASCGYVTKAFLALPKVEMAARDAANNAAEQLDKYVFEQRLVPLSLLAALYTDREVPDSVRIFEVIPDYCGDPVGNKRHAEALQLVPLYIAEFYSELLPGAFAFATDAIKLVNAIKTKDNDLSGSGPNPT